MDRLAADRVVAKSDLTYYTSTILSAHDSRRMRIDQSAAPGVNNRPGAGDCHRSRLDHSLGERLEQAQRSLFELSVRTSLGHNQATFSGHCGHTGCGATVFIGVQKA